MRLDALFARLFFIVISVIFMMAFAVGSVPSPSPWNYLWGMCLGLVSGGVLTGLDLVFKRCNLRSFNIGLIGLFIGYLMGLALNLILNAIIDISGIHVEHHFIAIIKIFLFLFGTYLGVMMTLRASDEIYVSIPFVKFTPSTQHTKDILLDLSALYDPRLIDLAITGLLDKRLVLPRFLLKELHSQEESEDENLSSKAKRALEVVKRLETLPGLNLRYQDTDFPEVKEIWGKVLRLARFLDADLLSADISRIQMAQNEGVRIINIHALSNALKPMMQRGQELRIKIQRHGKEELQGVGYLEDGTMVVVNGGGNYIGETIGASVLSVKHTTSGRMVFCNVTEQESRDSEEEY